MRIVAAGCLAALGLGLAVSACSAQEPERLRYSPKPADLSWLTKWFGGGSEEIIPKSSPPDPKQPPPMTVAQRAAERDRLEKAYLRRLDVCDRLRDIAQETNDTRLIEQANRLEELAWRLYQTRSNKLLGVASTAGGDEEPASGKAEPTTAEVLMKAKPGGALPPRLRQGGRLEPSRAEVPASRKEDQQ